MSMSKSTSTLPAMLCQAECTEEVLPQLKRCLAEALKLRRLGHGGRKQICWLKYHRYVCIYIYRERERYNM